jgi:hypothetical protein
MANKNEVQGEEHGVIGEHFAERTELLSTWGEFVLPFENDVLAPFIGGRLMGRPTWPTRSLSGVENCK